MNTDKIDLINDLIITGIPRSGTSYLCSLMSNVSNCVVINEPDRMSGKIRQAKLPVAVSDFHFKTREQLNSGNAIQNKLHSGKIIEDTAIVEQYVTYKPAIQSTDFLLGTKNTLGYMARLDTFKDIMPNVPVFACIRNPLDTIASWKDSFLHLESASASKRHIVGALNDEHISSWQRQKLQAFLGEERLPYRRAYFWAYLAEWLWLNRNLVHILFYEKIVTQPKLSIETIFNLSNSHSKLIFAHKIKPSEARKQKRRLLDNEDIEAIQTICYDSALNFGYDVFNGI